MSQPLTFRGKVSKIAHQHNPPKEPSYVGQRVTQKPSTMAVTVVIEQPSQPIEPKKPYDLDHARPEVQDFTPPRRKQKPRRKGVDTDESYADKLATWEQQYQDAITAAREKYEADTDWQRQRQRHWDDEKRAYEEGLATYQTQLASMADAYRQYVTLAGLLPLLQGHPIDVTITASSENAGMLPGLMESLLPGAADDAALQPLPPGAGAEETEG